METVLDLPMDVQRKLDSITFTFRDYLHGVSYEGSIITFYVDSEKATPAIPEQIGAYATETVPLPRAKAL